MGSQRLLAFLALQDRAVSRNVLAGTLWPEASEEHAHSSLRSSLARLGKLAREATLVTQLDVCIGSAVTTDIRESRALAHRLLLKGAVGSLADLAVESISLLASEMLPGWYDEWVMIEAEDWRQLRLHALDILAEQLLADDRYGDATAAARAGIRAEPLRESSRSALIRVHLAEGNQSEALSEYEQYRSLLSEELGIEPTPEISELMRGISET
jgi:DNA-binding SARP family transcriptional activator